MSKEPEEQINQLSTGNIITARDVAANMRLNEKTIYRLAASGELPGFKVGRSWRFLDSEIMKRIADAKLEEKIPSDSKGGRTKTA